MQFTLCFIYLQAARVYTGAYARLPRVMKLIWQDIEFQLRLRSRLASSRLGWLGTFVIKQAWSCIFGGVMVGAVILTSFIHLPWLAQYDWLFLIAIVSQILLVYSGLEQPKEVLTIIVFHLTGLGMELFKTSAAVGSWSYPGDAHIRLLTVPLFSGFMYAAVGSYIARSWRVLHLKFENYPNRVYTALLALAIYVNFFSHHFVWDYRALLFLAVLILYFKTTVSYRILDTTRRMPLIVGFGLVSLFIWFAENIGTYTKTWLYPNQIAHWHIVSINKIGSWFLLMIISFILVELMRHRFTSGSSTV